MNFIAGQLAANVGERAMVKLVEGSTVPVAANASGVAAGAKVTLGVRPEHVIARAQPSDGSVRAHVQLAEHLGDTTYLHVLVGGTTQMVVRTDPDNPINTGDAAHLVFPPLRCFLFDEQGMTLPNSVPAAAATAAG
jgi:multiple sugar transport system ATP-binding protein